MLITQIDPYDVIRDVTQSKKRIGKVKTTWQQSMETMFDVSELGLYHVYCKMSNFGILPQAYNWRGHATNLTSDDPHKKILMKKVNIQGLLFSESFIFLRKIACQ